MLESREGRVEELLESRPGREKLVVTVGEEKRRAINYPRLTGSAELNDRVVLNTTACSLELGTGGYDFVIRIKGQTTEREQVGHIMKLRYTPYQLQTCTLAEEESPYHEQIKEFSSLCETPVVVGSLHSMLPVITLMIKDQLPAARIAYIMTDGAALPLNFSRLVYQLTQADLIETTITIGHAFGGDQEAVNIYSGLIGAYQIEAADLIIVTMGPGIVGTGTKYGFSGTEQATLVQAVDQLGGTPILVPRVSFADPRPRHYGLSHHTRTNLGELIPVETTVGLPLLPTDQQEVIARQLEDNGINEKHNLIYQSGETVISRLIESEFEVTTMGRSYREAPAYFQTVGIAGQLAADMVGSL